MTAVDGRSMTVNPRRLSAEAKGGGVEHRDPSRAKTLVGPRGKEGWAARGVNPGAGWAKD